MSRLSRILDKPVSELTAEKVAELNRALPEEMAYSRWQLKFRPDEPVPLEWIDWHLEREVRDPFPIEYCAARAAVASERRFR